jgi:hypothetical protein
MFCNKCGYEVGDNYNFCPGCGNNLKAIAQTTSQAVLVTKNHLAHEPAVPELVQFLVTAYHAAQLRSIFNSVGYKHPHTTVSKDYNAFFRRIEIEAIDPETESIIVHFGIGKYLTDGIMASSVKFKQKDGKTDLNVTQGELIVTNRRLVVLAGLGMFGTPEGFSYDFSNFKRIEPTEYQHYSEFTLYGKGKYSAHLEMKFQSMRAVLGQMIQVANAFGKSSSSSVVGYIERKDQEQTTQNYINAHLAQTRSLKQAFTELLLFLVNPQTV